jgi:hypothetical protein
MGKSMCDISVVAAKNYGRKMMIKDMTAFSKLIRRYSR